MPALLRDHTQRASAELPEGVNPVRGKLVRNLDRAGTSDMSKPNPTGDIIIDKLVEMGRPLTVDNYISLAYWNRTRESLEGEELAELEELIESDQLADTDSDYVA
jgi:hypothetical protein